MRALASLFVLTACALNAQAPVNPAGPYPDRTILTWAGDPATTQGITWRTDKSVLQGEVEIAPAGDGPKFKEKAKPEKADSKPFTSDGGEVIYHSAKLTGLLPDTLYAYRVGDGKHWSEWHHFRTAKAQAARLKILYIGDAQNDIFEHWSRLIRTAYGHAADAHVLVHAGDLVNRGTTDALWGEWFRSAGWIFPTLPSLPSPGNHEYSNRVLTPHWRAQYTLPENGVAGVEESNYYVDVQGVRMISLNSNEKHKEQAEWLDALLTNNPQKWTVIFFHHPIYSAARGRDNKDLRAMWQPVFDKHKVDIVLQGHDHTYARSNLATGVNTRAGTAGTVYVVSVSGPKMYKVEREPWMVRAAQDTQLFQTLVIEGNTLRYESRTARGILYDAFDLVKQPKGPNRLINKVPATPELAGQ